MVNLLAVSSRALLLVGYIFGFFWLALTWKWDKKLGKFSVINRAFAPSRLLGDLSEMQLLLISV